jgi:hypothetical protein
MAVRHNLWNSQKKLRSARDAVVSSSVPVQKRQVCVCEPAEVAALPISPFSQSAVAIFRAAVSCERDLEEEGCARLVNRQPCILFAFRFLRKTEIDACARLKTYTLWHVFHVRTLRNSSPAEEIFCDSDVCSEHYTVCLKYYVHISGTV